MSEYRLNIGDLTDTEFDLLKLSMNAGAFDRLGIPWSKKIAWHPDFETNQLDFITED